MKSENELARIDIALHSLMTALNAADEGAITEISYNKEADRVFVKLYGREISINVACDSVLSIVSDVVGRLYNEML